MNDNTTEAGRTCPACGEGRLQPQAEREAAEHHGQSGELVLRFAVCDTCGADLTSAKDARHNKRAMNAFKKRVDGLLAGDEIKGFRERFKLTQKLAAELIGGGEVAFSRYESDDIVQSAAMDTALRLCISSPSNLLTLAQIKGVSLPRGIVTRVANDHQDRLLFMTRAIREHLDKELSETRVRRSGRGESIFERSHVTSFSWARFQHWGNA